MEDYVDGESDMSFTSSEIDISDIRPSTLANSGLLMAEFIVDGETAVNVNMVVNVTNNNGRFLKEVLNPLE